MKRKVLLVLLLVVVIAIGVGIWLYTKPVANYAEQSADISISAKELIAAFDADTAAATKRFSDKTIRVTGLLKSADSTAIVLGEEGTASEVVIGLDDRNLLSTSGTKVGDSITVQARFAGYEKSTGDDLLSSLGTTIKLSHGGLISSPK